MQNHRPSGLSSALRRRASRIRAAASGDNRNMLLFALEGVLIMFVMNMTNMNNNLFATRLGASPTQLSLVTALPQAASMLILIPGAFFTDRLKNKRSMVIGSMTVVGTAFFLMSFISALGPYRLYGFFFLLVLSAAPFALYTSSWQAFFADVVPIERRNRDLSFRSRLTFIVGIAVPLATGFILSSISDNEGKIRTHQIFFLISAVLIVFQILTLRKIRGGVTEKPSVLTLKRLKTVSVSLAHNKRFVGFVAVALFFYISWHLDWTMFYYGQITYLESNEAWLSYANVGSALMQFFTIGLWSRINEKMGVRFTIIIGSLGLTLCPIGLLVGTALPHEIGRPVFIVLHAFFNIAFAVVQLNILQCLLQVIDLNYKTLSIAIYTVLVTLSNAVFPAVGVQIYEAFGADLAAFQKTFYIIMALRAAATFLWFLRWRMLRNEPK